MARDNGSRGSYRHVSGSLAKNAANHVEHEHDDSAVPSSPTDSNTSPPLPQKFKNLKRDRIDDLGSSHGNAFFDSVPRSLNDKYPTLFVPGTMPRRSSLMPRRSLEPPQQVGGNHFPTWTQVLIAGGLYGFALYGFLFTIYTGCKDVGVYILALVAELCGLSA